MTGANGDALDWALAPDHGQGHSAACPLPGDADLLLQVAAGSAGDVLAAAAERHRMDVAEALQKVRARLRAVLFHPQADAYRVLGLDIGADADAIKLHHRLLQQWLHPDRHPGEQDALLAARANAAWQALRTPERRMAYDAEQAMRKARLAQSDAAGTLQSAAVPPQRTPEWRRRAPLLALGGAFAGLFGLALHDQYLGSQPGEQLQAADGAASGAGIPATPQAALTGGPAVADFRPAPPAMPGLARRRDEQASAAPIAEAAIPLEIEEAMSRIEPPDASMAVQEIPATVASNRDAAIDRSPASAASPAVEADIRPPAKNVATVAAALAVASTDGESIEQPHADAPGPAPATMPETAHDGRDTPVATGMPSVAQVRAAERTGARLLAFLRQDGDGVPPIWNSLSAQRGAMQLREGGRLEVPASDPPAWRVGSRAASMRARLAVREGEMRAWLVAQMVWREQRWLVEEVAVTGDMP